MKDVAVHRNLIVDWTGLGEHNMLSIYTVCTIPFATRDVEKISQGYQPSLRTQIMSLYMLRPQMGEGTEIYVLLLTPGFDHYGV